MLQIVEDSGKGNHAGVKATEDIARVADGLRFKRLSIRWARDSESFMGTVIRQIYFLLDWKKAYMHVPENSIVLMQHPYHHKQLTRSRMLYEMKKMKHV